MSGVGRLSACFLLFALLPVVYSTCDPVCRDTKPAIGVCPTITYGDIRPPCGDAATTDCEVMIGSTPVVLNETNSGALQSYLLNNSIINLPCSTPCDWTVNAGNVLECLVCAGNSDKAAAAQVPSWLMGWWTGMAQETASVWIDNVVPVLVSNSGLPACEDPYSNSSDFTCARFCTTDERANISSRTGVTITRCQTAQPGVSDLCGTVDQTGFCFLVGRDYVGCQAVEPFLGLAASIPCTTNQSLAFCGNTTDSGCQIAQTVILDSNNRPTTQISLQYPCGGVVADQYARYCTQTEAAQSCFDPNPARCFMVCSDVDRTQDCVYLRQCKCQDPEGPWNLPEVGNSTIFPCTTKDAAFFCGGRPYTEKTCLVTACLTNTTSHVEVCQFVEGSCDCPYSSPLDDLPCGQDSIIVNCTDSEFSLQPSRLCGPGGESCVANCTLDPMGTDFISLSSPSFTCSPVVYGEPTCQCSGGFDLNTFFSDQPCSSRGVCTAEEWQMCGPFTSNCTYVGIKGNPFCVCDNGTANYALRAPCNSDSGTVIHPCTPGLARRCGLPAIVSDCSMACTKNIITLMYLMGRFLFPGDSEAITATTHELLAHPSTAFEANGVSGNASLGVCVHMPTSCGCNYPEQRVFPNSTHVVGTAICLNPMLCTPAQQLSCARPDLCQLIPNTPLVDYSSCSPTIVVSNIPLPDRDCLHFCGPTTRSCTTMCTAQSSPDPPYYDPSTVANCSLSAVNIICKCNVSNVAGCGGDNLQPCDTTNTSPLQTGWDCRPCQHWDVLPRACTDGESLEVCGVPQLPPNSDYFDLIGHPHGCQMNLFGPSPFSTTALQRTLFGAVVPNSCPANYTIRNCTSEEFYQNCGCPGDVSCMMQCDVNGCHRFGLCASIIPCTSDQAARFCPPGAATATCLVRRITHNSSYVYDYITGSCLCPEDAPLNPNNGRCDPLFLRNCSAPVSLHYCGDPSAVSVCTVSQNITDAAHIDCECNPNVASKLPAMLSENRMAISLPSLACVAILRECNGSEITTLAGQYAKNCTAYCAPYTGAVNITRSCVLATHECLPGAFLLPDPTVQPYQRAIPGWPVRDLPCGSNAFTQTETLQTNESFVTYYCPTTGASSATVTFTYNISSPSSPPIATVNQCECDAGWTQSADHLTCTLGRECSPEEAHNFCGDWNDCVIICDDVNQTNCHYQDSPCLHQTSFSGQCPPDLALSACGQWVNLGRCVVTGCRNYTAGDGLANCSDASVSCGQCVHHTFNSSGAKPCERDYQVVNCNAQDYLPLCGPSAVNCTKRVGFDHPVDANQCQCKTAQEGEAIWLNGVCPSGLVLDGCDDSKICGPYTRFTVKYCGENDASQLVREDFSRCSTVCKCIDGAVDLPATANSPVIPCGAMAQSCSPQQVLDFCNCSSVGRQCLSCYVAVSATNPRDQRLLPGSCQMAPLPVSVISDYLTKPNATGHYLRKCQTAEKWGCTDWDALQWYDLDPATGENSRVKQCSRRCRKGQYLSSSLCLADNPGASCTQLTYNQVLFNFNGLTCSGGQCWFNAGGQTVYVTVPSETYEACDSGVSNCQCQPGVAFRPDARNTALPARLVQGDATQLSFATSIGSSTSGLCSIRQGEWAPCSPDELSNPQQPFGVCGYFSAKQRPDYCRVRQYIVTPETIDWQSWTNISLSEPPLPPANGIPTYVQRFHHCLCNSYFDGHVNFTITNQLSDRDFIKIWTRQDPFRDFNDTLFAASCDVNAIAYMPFLSSSSSCPRPPSPESERCTIAYGYDARFPCPTSTITQPAAYNGTSALADAADPSQLNFLLKQISSSRPTSPQDRSRMPCNGHGMCQRRSDTPLQPFRIQGDFSNCKCIPSDFTNSYSRQVARNPETKKQLDTSIGIAVGAFAAAVGLSWLTFGASLLLLFFTVPVPGTDQKLTIDQFFSVDRFTADFFNAKRTAFVSMGNQFETDDGSFLFKFTDNVDNTFDTYVERANNIFCQCGSAGDNFTFTPPQAGIAGSPFQDADQNTVVNRAFGVNVPNPALTRPINFTFTGGHCKVVNYDISRTMGSPTSAPSPPAPTTASNAPLLACLENAILSISDCFLQFGQPSPSPGGSSYFNRSSGLNVPWSCTSCGIDDPAGWAQRFDSGTQASDDRANLVQQAYLLRDRFMSDPAFAKAWSRSPDNWQMVSCDDCDCIRHLPDNNPVTADWHCDCTKWANNHTLLSSVPVSVPFNTFYPYSQCICDPGWQGTACEFRAPPPYLPFYWDNILSIQGSSIFINNASLAAASAANNTKYYQTLRLPYPHLYRLPVLSVGAQEQFGNADDTADALLYYQPTYFEGSGGYPLAFDVTLPYSCPIITKYDPGVTPDTMRCKTPSVWGRTQEEMVLCNTSPPGTCPVWESQCGPHGHLFKTECVCDPGWTTITPSILLPYPYGNCPVLDPTNPSCITNTPNLFPPGYFGFTYWGCYKSLCDPDPDRTKPTVMGGDLVECSGRGQCLPTPTNSSKYACVCDPAFDTRNCAFPTGQDPPPESPCNVGGGCNGRGNCKPDYTGCVCNAAALGTGYWNGTTCDTPICTPGCQNGGICQPYLDMFVCQCSEGWVGPTCSQSVCPSTPNGGVCNGHGTCNVATKTCCCDATWHGCACNWNDTSCVDPSETRVSPCGSVGLTIALDPLTVNDKTCPANTARKYGCNFFHPTPITRSRHCLCDPLRSGTYCNSNTCPTANGQPCNGGVATQATCDTTASPAACVCIPKVGYWSGTSPALIGNNCTIDVTSQCTQLVTLASTTTRVMCSNAGQCLENPETNTYRCVCITGRGGAHCERIECTPPCVHGTCLTLTAGALCNCQPGWVGTNCNTTVCPTGTVPAFDGREWSCVCSNNASFAPPACTQLACPSTSWTSLDNTTRTQQCGQLFNPVSQVRQNTVSCSGGKCLCGANLSPTDVISHTGPDPTTGLCIPACDPDPKKTLSVVALTSSYDGKSPLRPSCKCAIGYYPEGAFNFQQLGCRELYCMNNGTFTGASNAFPTCSCLSMFSGPRCASYQQPVGQIAIVAVVNNTGVSTATTRRRLLATQDVANGTTLPSFDATLPPFYEPDAINGSTQFTFDPDAVVFNVTRITTYSPNYNESQAGNIAIGFNDIIPEDALALYESSNTPFTSVAPTPITDLLTSTNVATYGTFFRYFVSNTENFDTFTNESGTFQLVFQCTFPWTGPTCSDSLCQNNGVIVDNSACSCPGLWTGDDCSVDSCEPNGFISLTDNSMCSCPPLFGGVGCVDDLCDPFGEYNETTGVCDCYTGHAGAVCEICTDVACECGVLLGCNTTTEIGVGTSLSHCSCGCLPAWGGVGCNTNLCGIHGRPIHNGRACECDFPFTAVRARCQGPARLGASREEQITIAAVTLSVGGALFIGLIIVTFFPSIFTNLGRRDGFVRIPKSD